MRKNIQVFIYLIIISHSIILCTRIIPINLEVFHTNTFLPFAAHHSESHNDVSLPDGGRSIGHSEQQKSNASVYDHSYLPENSARHLGRSDNTPANVTADDNETGILIVLNTNNTERYDAKSN